MLILSALVGSVKVIDYMSKKSVESLQTVTSETIVIDTVPSIDEVKSEIVIWSVLLGVDNELMLRIANCESGFKWNASNNTSSAKGIYQWIDGTWAGTTSAKRGLHQYDWQANIKEAVIRVYTKGTGDWEADPRSENCWNI